MENEKINIKKRPESIHLDLEPTPELVKSLISIHKNNYLERYKKLQNYYEGYSDILSREKTDPSKPNNRLVSGYPSYIVDLMQGYFVGKPITYTSEDKRLIEDIQNIFNYNDEQDENSELAKMAGIKGRAYEIVYIDEESNIRFNEMDADDVIIVYDTKINPETNFAISVSWGNNSSEILKQPLRAIVYTKDRIITYEDTSNGLTIINEEEHYFKQVPVIEFLNNDEGIGDFERVESLINAYDLASSDTANDFEEFTDAFLVLAGMEGTNNDDVEELRKNRIILTDGEKQSAYWLIKEINDTAVENYKDRLNNDIHKFAKIPDISDEKFTGNASGIAMTYKLLALNQVIAGKQRKFKRALQKRLELICSYLAIKGKQYDYRDISINFTNNQPVNEKEMVEMAIQMLGITSRTTALAKVPGVDDVELELAKIEIEQGDYQDQDLDKIELEEGDEDEFR